MTLHLPKKYLEARIVVLLMLLLMSGWLAAHEYLEKNLLIIHPWSDAVEKGAPRAILGLEIQDITAIDRLIGASTPVAKSVSLVIDGKTSDAKEGIALIPGEHVVLDEGSNHFVLHDVLRDLEYGQQYPIFFVFEKAGTVEVEFLAGHH
jgi:copper(I)-binding protein